MPRPFPLNALLAATAVAPLLNATVFAAAPSIRNLSLRGLQAGGTTTLVVDGTDLLPEPTLVATFPIAKQTLRADATATRIEIEVTLDKGTAAGIYDLRVATGGGISDAVAISIDGLAQLPIAAELKTMPAAYHGALAGATRATATFAGKAGQSLIFEVEAQRLGSGLRPVLHLYDEHRIQLAWSWPQPSLFGDTRLAVTLPADGQYTVELHDQQYAGPGPGFYRLKVGNWNYADLVFPAAVQQATPAKLELIGAGGKTGSVSLKADMAGITIPVPWPADTGSSGPRARIAVSPWPEIVETTNDGKTPQQISSSPVGINGRLSKPGEVDRYQLTVKPESKLRFEVFAERSGSAIDSILDIENEKGTRLAGNDDGAGLGSSDSLLEYTVPKDVTTLILAIRDAHGRGDPRCVYRMLVLPASGDPAAPDFQLFVDRATHNVSTNALAVFRVVVERRGYDGPIEIAPDKLPPGVNLSGGTIPAGANGTLLTLSGKAGKPARLVTSIRGVGQGTPPLVRYAKMETHPLAAVQPWLRREVAVALSTPSEDVLEIGIADLAGDATLALAPNGIVPVWRKE